MSVDPTRIDIEVDGKTKLQGRTVHGNMLFVCDVVSKITDNLYMGGIVSGEPVPDEITRVLSLYKWEQYDLAPHQERIEVTMHDAASGVDFNEAIELAHQVNTWRAQGHTVLVHCQAGLNRSGLVTALTLMLQGLYNTGAGDSLTAREAIRLLRDKRDQAVLCNSSFENFLEGYEIGSRAAA